MAKINTSLRRKRLKGHTLWGRTYLYSAYKAVTTRDSNIQVQDTTCFALKYEFLVRIL